MSVDFASIVLMITSMGVSRLLFPWFTFLGEPELHRYLATAVLTLGVLHGGMHGIWRAKKKRAAISCLRKWSATFWIAKLSRSR